MASRAWGYDAHKFIVDRAISLLPDAVRPLLRPTGPSSWSTQSIRISGATASSIEDPNHYLDFDWEGYGPYPFAGLPRNREEAIKKFGKETIDKYGTLPWRTEEMYGKLKDAFAAYPRRGSYCWSVLLRAWLGAYVAIVRAYRCMPSWIPTVRRPGSAGSIRASRR